jgi:hypothetical protein
MTQELDKNGRPKLYCANCGKRMAHTYQQQWFGCSGYRYWGYWDLKKVNRTYLNRADAEVELQRLNALGYRDRGWSSTDDVPLHIREVNGYGSQQTEYFVDYSEPVGEPIPYQFHSQECMMKFLQRSDIIRQILPIITANRHAPIIPAKKPRKKPQRKNTLPDYDAMSKRIESMI